MKIRRVVTGRDTAGKSIFVSDGTPPVASEFVHVPGMAVSLGWKSDVDAASSSSNADPTLEIGSFVPSVGGTTLLIVTFPPDSVRASPEFDPIAAGGESMRLLPGLAETFERAAPGMHTTPTLDYGVLLDGELSLELDDGAVKALKPRDVVVQNGTRHAWRNSSNRPATMLFVLIGARHG